MYTLTSPHSVHTNITIQCTHQHHHTVYTPTSPYSVHTNITIQCTHQHHHTVYTLTSPYSVHTPTSLYSVHTNITIQCTHQHHHTVYTHQHHHTVYTPTSPYSVHNNYMHLIYRPVIIAPNIFRHYSRIKNYCVIKIGYKPIAFLYCSSSLLVCIRHLLLYPTWGLYHSNWVGFNYHKPQPYI